MTDLIKEFIAPDRPNRPGTNINVRSITIHNTSNAGRGQTPSRIRGSCARRASTCTWVSWHFTVDDGAAIQHLPINEKAFHAGPANGTSIGIEICMHQGIDQQAANERAAQLVATLLRDLDLSVDSVPTHESWTGKECPTLLCRSAQWAAFLALIRTASGGLESEPEATSAGERPPQQISIPIQKLSGPPDPPIPPRAQPPMRA